MAARKQKKHTHRRVFNFVLQHDTQIENGQDKWKWCNNCQVLAFAGNPDQGACPNRRVRYD